jgi:hypothetical protein
MQDDFPLTNSGGFVNELLGQGYRAARVGIERRRLKLIEKK